MEEKLMAEWTFLELQCSNWEGEHPSGAKALAYLAAVSARLKSRPDTSRGDEIAKNPE